MSMNLAFVTKEGNHHVEFPYQVSTNVSKEVISKKNINDQIDILKNDLKSFINIYDQDDAEWFAEKVDEITEMLNDDTLKLIII